MIGILCEKNKKNKYSKKFLKLLKIDNNYKTESIIIFSVFDLDLKNKTVNGNLITQSQINSIKMPITGVIYNFLSPRKRTNKKKIRALAEQPDIILINEVNRFKQHMIMEMLSSSPKTKGFVPNYSIYDNSRDKNGVLQKSETLVFPETGSDCKICYNSNIIKNLLSKKKWLVLDIPNTFKQNGDSIVFTLYAVRSADDKWTTLPLSESMLEVADDSLTKVLYKSALEIAECISSFIPSLAFCTIKFVTDENNSPFLVSFSGWDSSLLLKKQKFGLLNLLAEYFLSYSNLLQHSKGEEDYVD